MKNKFTRVIYLRCPNCKNTFDPKGHMMDEIDGTIKCNFCGTIAEVDMETMDVRYEKN